MSVLPETRTRSGAPTKEVPGEYPVNALALAGFLKARGFHLLRIGHVARDGQEWGLFVFADAGNGAIQKARYDFYHYQGTVDGRTLSECYGQLKRQVRESLKEQIMNAKCHTE